jgi:hypothetical protein
VRATKFHQIRILSGKGGPPISRTPSAVRARKAGARARGAEVVQHPSFEELAVDRAIAAHHENGVLEIRIERQHQLPSAMHLHIGS